MKLRSLVLTLLLVSLAASVVAQPLSAKNAVRWGRWEFGLRMLYTGAQDYEGAGGSSIAIEDDLGLGFAFGYNFDERFRLAVEFAWGDFPYDATVVDAEDPGSLIPYTGELSTASSRLSGDWNILPGRFTPYVSGSIGVVMIDTNILAGWETDCVWDPWWGYICGQVPRTYGDDAATFSLGGGLRMHVSDQVFLKLGYEHGWNSGSEVDGQHHVRFDVGLLY